MIDTFIATTDDIEAGQTDLSYDAVTSSPRRKSPTNDNRTEDKILNRSSRQMLTGTTKRLARNFAVTKWMIRKHLDYVSAFTFQMSTDDEGLNQAIEDLMEEQSRPANCDVSRRFSLRRMLRLAEMKAVTEGDIGLLKVQPIRKGQRLARLQAIEGDRVRNPDKAGDNWEHGIKVNSAYAHLKYAIHKRVNRQYEHERTVSANRMIWHNGYVDNFDQVRGISPLASGLNSLQDVHENFDYALARAKISQLFAMAFTSQPTEFEEDGTPADEEGESEDEPTAYEVDFGRGPVQISLDPGDDAKFLESKQPSSEFQSFTQMVLQVALKSLDLPYSFYSEDFTNFFGSRGALMQYERSCRSKRESLQELLRQITIFFLQTWILNGELKLPNQRTIRDLKWEWVPDGIPWWDPAKEIRGDLMAIGAGLDNPQRICKERGRGDFNENVRQIKKALDYAESLGVALSFDPGAGDPVPAKNGEEDNE